MAGYRADQRVPEIGSRTGPKAGGKAGAVLMKTHRSYLPVIQQLTKAGVVAGMAHITGGGITENVPRILPKGTAAEIDLGSWAAPPLFRHLQELGNVSEEEMLRTFNMGIGLVVVAPAAKFKRAQGVLSRAGEAFHVIGQVVQGDGSVRYTREPETA